MKVLTILTTNPAVYVWFMIVDKYLEIAVNERSLIVFIITWAEILKKRSKGGRVCFVDR